MEDQLPAGSSDDGYQGNLTIAAKNQKGRGDSSRGDLSTWEIIKIYDLNRSAQTNEAITHNHKNT